MRLLSLCAALVIHFAAAVQLPPKSVAERLRDAELAGIEYYKQVGKCDNASNGVFDQQKRRGCVEQSSRSLRDKYSSNRDNETISSLMSPPPPAALVRAAPAPAPTPAPPPARPPRHPRWHTRDRGRDEHAHTLRNGTSKGARRGKFDDRSGGAMGLLGAMLALPALTITLAGATWAWKFAHFELLPTAQADQPDVPDDEGGS